MRLRTRIVVAAGVLVVLALAALGVVFDAGRKVTPRKGERHEHA